MQLVSKIFNLCGHDPPTDGWTDGQTTCDSKTVLCTVVHCAVKSNGGINILLMLNAGHVCSWCVVVAQSRASHEPQSARSCGKASIILSVVGIVLAVIVTILYYFVLPEFIMTHHASTKVSE